MRARRGAATFYVLTLATALALAGCAIDATQRAAGPAEIRLAPYTRLKVTRDLIFLPPAESAKLMERLGEETTPRMLVIFATGSDARGTPHIELVGWDEAPAARSFMEELGTEFARSRP